MKTLFRWAFRLLILLVVLFVAGILLLNPIAREIVEYKITQNTGLEVKLDAVQIGLLNPRVTVKGLVIYNRPEFGGSPLLDLPELHLEYDRHALESRQLHFRFLRLNLAQINIVEDTHGRLNLQALQQQSRKNGSVTVSTSKSADYQFTGIDTLNLTIGTTYFRSLKNPALNETLNPRMTNNVYLKVSSLTPVFDLILLKSGINPVMPGNGRTNDPTTYWLGKLRTLGTN